MCNLNKKTKFWKTASLKSLNWKIKVKQIFYIFHLCITKYEHGVVNIELTNEKRKFYSIYPTFISTRQKSETETETI